MNLLTPSQIHFVSGGVNDNGNGNGHANEEDACNMDISFSGLNLTNTCGIESIELMELTIAFKE